MLEHPGLLNVLPWNSCLDCVQYNKLSLMFGIYAMLAFLTVCVLKLACLPLIFLLSNCYVRFSIILSLFLVLYLELFKHIEFTCL